MMVEKQLAWVDVETTGTYAPTQSLLEVACIMTDIDLNVLDDSGFHRVIQYSDVDAVKAEAIPYVVDMHAATGLWDLLPSGTPAGVVDQELLTYIQGFNPEPKTARLAGNSVRLDLNFMEEYLPDSYDHLHYRMFDVSTFAGAADWWYPGVKYEKKHTHSAREDILESLEEMRYLRKMILK